MVVSDEVHTAIPLTHPVAPQNSLAFSDQVCCFFKLFKIFSRFSHDSNKYFPFSLTFFVYVFIAQLLNGFGITPTDQKSAEKILLLQENATHFAGGFFDLHKLSYFTVLIAIAVRKGLAFKEKLYTGHFVIFSHLYNNI